MKKYFGTAEIMIEANQKSPSWFFRIERAERYKNRLEYGVGAIETNGTYKNKKESVGIDLNVTCMISAVTSNFTEIDGTKEKINLINGINSNRYLDFWNVYIEGGPAILDQLNDERNILLSYILKDKLAAKKGDLLTLKMRRGKRAYKVIGFFNSLMWGGSYGLIAERYFKLDIFQTKYY